MIYVGFNRKDISGIVILNNESLTYLDFSNDFSPHNQRRAWIKALYSMTQVRKEKMKEYKDMCILSLYNPKFDTVYSTPLTWNDLPEIKDVFFTYCKPF